MPTETFSRLQMRVTGAQAQVLDAFKKYVLDTYGANQLSNRVMAIIYREMQNVLKQGYKPKKNKQGGNTMSAILVAGGLLFGAIFGLDAKPPKEQEKTVVLRNGHAENSLTENLHYTPADVVIRGYQAK